MAYSWDDVVSVGAWWRMLLLAVVSLVGWAGLAGCSASETGGGDEDDQPIVIIPGEDDAGGGGPSPDAGSEPGDVGSEDVDEGCTEGSCSGFQYCDRESGSCREGCAEDAQCGSREVCESSTHECVCESGAERFDGECYPTDSTACSTANCSSGESCDFDEETCREGCRVDGHCSTGQSCDGATGTCTCAGDEERRFGERCVQSWVLSEGGHDPELVIGRDERPHIVYSLGTSDSNASIIHVTPSGSSWSKNVIARLDQPHGFGPPPVDATAAPSGQPRAMYPAGRAAQLGYAEFDGLSWSGIWIADSESSGFGSIAVDSQGRTAIADQHLTDDYLYFLSRNGGEFEAETVDDTEGAGEDISLAFDPDDHPHIVYTTQDTATIKHAQSDGSSWEIDSLPDELGASESTAVELRIDANGTPHVAAAAVEPDPQELRYATRDAEGEWETEVVGTSDDFALEFGMQLDADGHPHLAIRSHPEDPDASASIRYAGWTGSEWRSETIFEDHSLEQNVDLALLDDGSGYVAFVQDRTVRWRRVELY